MIMNMRKRATLIMLVVLVAFVGLMVLGWGADITGRGFNPRSSKGDKNTLAVVGKEKYTISDFIPYVRSLIAEVGENRWYRLSPQEQSNMLDSIWNQALSDLQWSQLLKQENVLLSEQELQQIVVNFPPPDFRQDTLFFENGQFSSRKYLELISGSNLPPDRQMILARYINMLIRDVPRNEIMTDISFSSRLTRSQLEDIRAKFGTSMELQALFMYDYPKVDTVVSEAEIDQFIKKNPDLFKQKKWWELLAFRFFVAPTASDSIALKERVDDVADALSKGYDFEQASIDFTGDSSKLVSWPIEFMSPDMKVYFDSLKVGMISPAFFYRGAWHIVKLEERLRDSISYREILIPLQAGGETRNVVMDRIAEFTKKAKESKLDSLVLDSLSRANQVPILRGVIIFEDRDINLPNFPYTQTLKTFAVNSKVGDVSGPFPEAMGSYFVFATIDAAKGKTIPRDQQIAYARERIIYDRQKEAQKELADRIRLRLEQGADFSSILNDAGLNRDSILSISDLKFRSYFEADSRYGPRLAGACYYLREGQMTGPVVVSEGKLGYGFFRCISRQFDPAVEFISQGIQGETGLIAESFFREFFSTENVKDYRNAANFTF